MKLAIVNVQCGNCCKWYRDLKFSGWVYGEFLLRSSSGEMRYLNAHVDEVYTEVSTLIGNDGRIDWNADTRDTETLYYVFGAACDPDSQGMHFRIGRWIPCPYCHNQSAADFTSPEPPECVDVEVAPVTHNAWKALDQEEKQLQVANTLTDYLRTNGR